MAKRGCTNHSFIIGINKPKGPSSHDVVNRLRGFTGERRCGHTGTLDPLASGVMLLCAGPATRLEPYIVSQDKTYTFDIAFGSCTSTGDTQGEVLQTSQHEDFLSDSQFANSTLNNFTGKMSQVPPAYSAIKIGGKTSYKLAREGKSTALAPRDIEVKSISLVNIEPYGSSVLWRVKACVSKGTYIRSLAQDIASSIGCCAHVSFLHRNSNGFLDEKMCVNLDDLHEICIDDILKYALDPVQMLNIAHIELSDEDMAKVSNGNKLCVSLLPSTYTSGNIGVTYAGRLQAIYALDSHVNALTCNARFSIGVIRGENRIL